ncbi:MAG TPA: hemerythrin domain-containing protein [Nitrospira sp.]|jgi:Hemerythrin HHE cation binding domain|nr:hemerythrin domain-containing protein [Nitrospira sp.]
MREPRSKNDDMEENEMDNGTEAESGGDVFEMLKTDHRHVQDLFTRFEDADKRTRTSIADEALTALEVHSALEEELVYPAIAEVIDNEETVNEAKEEHHVAKLLIKELHKMDAGDEAFATKFKVLGEIVGHHIEEEEGEVFPQAEEAGFESESISEEVSKRKAKLMQKFEGGKKSSGSRRKKAA